MTVEETLYPEMAAGGFCRVDHRGKWKDDPSPFRRQLGMLRGQVRRVVGADVDPAVEKNEGVDERVVLEHDAPLPFEDEIFDLICAFSVLEHLDAPKPIADELARVLKPGGWIIGWTPNRYGYVAVDSESRPSLGA